MKNFRKSLWVGTLAVGMVMGGLVTLEGQQAGSPRQAVVAVVDVQQVVQKMDERAAIDAELVRMKEDRDREDADKVQEIRALQADLQVLAPGSRAYQETQKKITEKTVYLNAWRELAGPGGRMLESEKAIRMEALYRKIVDAIERLAKRNGYDLVLYKDETEAARGQTQQQVATIITLRKVLYSDPALDITATITQTLNNEYNNKR